MKKLLIILFVAITVFVMSGCASILTGNNTSFFSTGTVSLAKRGEASSTVWFGLFGQENYPAVDKVAKDNGINRIATVERYAKLGVFGLWTTYTTIVTGE
jgi:uncharacterized protein YceK